MGLVLSFRVLPFLKMHGLGNDYVYVDAVNAPAIERRRDLPKLARALSDRHFGIGADGLILVCRPTDSDAHVRMRMFNADGTEAEMCGNGVRCVAKLAHDRLGIRANPMLVETTRGVLPIAYRSSKGKLTRATVDMGEPIIELHHIPVERRHLTRGRKPFEWKLDADGMTIPATFVSMGNPHAVVFVPPGKDADGFSAKSIGAVDLHELGPMLEEHPAFPSRANIHFVEVHRKNEASMITWERGTGPTLACGTGACAALVAGVLTGRLARAATINVPGGELTVEWDDDINHVFLTGPAAEVFEGVWPERARTGALSRGR